MDDRWPLDALKAQAITARVYTAIRVTERQNNSSAYYDVVDTVSHQVYKAYNPNFTNAIKAVEVELEPEVLSFGERVVEDRTMLGILITLIVISAGLLLTLITMLVKKRQNSYNI